MTHRIPQRGLTLVVSLIMLVVLTLLVVSAIRFGNVSLKITGNAQTETEATAATQQAVDQVLQEIVAADSLSSLEAKTVTVSTGAASYQVKVEKPGCIFSKNVKNTDLNPAKEADQRCFGEGGQADGPVATGGLVVTGPPVCKEQQWDLQASLTSAAANNNANTTIVQGVTLRVPGELDCP
jgi:hypothetical protein